MNKIFKNQELNNMNNQLKDNNQLKEKIIEEHFKNIRTQQSYERMMNTFANLVRYNALYVLPLLLSGSIGYRIHYLGTSSKIIIVKCFMTILCRQKNPGNGSSWISLGMKGR